jgi:lipopolysaccharide/colanic/teichoic acid biosynthesis glycosyltransferase
MNDHDRTVERLRRAFGAEEFSVPVETIARHAQHRRQSLHWPLRLGSSWPVPQRRRQHAESVAVLSRRRVRLTGRQAAIKRAFDIVAASAALVVSLPLLVGIAVAIRLTSRGPVFSYQERVTKGGRIFRMHKFRTMRTDIDADPGLTRVGGFIWRASLDELPQFWNVLKGEMSIVGPRPLTANQMVTDPERLVPRQEIRAGVTGWWQIKDRNWLTWEEARRLDLFYIENWSLTLDLYILFRSASQIIRLSASGQPEPTPKMVAPTIGSSAEGVWPPRLRPSLLNAVGGLPQP